MTVAPPSESDAARRGDCSKDIELPLPRIETCTSAYAAIEVSTKAIAAALFQPRALGGHHLECPLDGFILAQVQVVYQLLDLVLASHSLVVPLDQLLLLLRKVQVLIQRLLVDMPAGIVHESGAG